MSEFLQRNRNPHDIAETLSISVKEAKCLVETQTSELEGWGPLSKQVHIISRRAAHGFWPRAHTQRIEYFQKLHDEGRVNICTGRDGSYFILYAMPNKTIAKRNPYFFVDRGY